MAKSEDEIYEYVLNYKNNLIHDKESEKSKAFDNANSADNKLSTQLIFNSTVLLTVIGGLITTSKAISNDGVKVLLTIAVISLLLSVCSGLLHFVLVNKFFKIWGDHLHKQAGTVNNDRSKDVEGLEKLLEKLQKQSDNLPNKSNPFFSITQAISFVIGVVSVLIVVLIKIYT